MTILPGLFPEPAPDFSDPLGVLRACHHRARRHCGTLIRLAPKMGKGATDADVRAAARSLYRYFSQAAPQHHADEDIDLFPRLGRDPGLAPLLKALAGEHQAQAHAWELIAPAFADPETILGPGTFERAAQAFARAYLLHMETEDRLLLPAADSLLDAGEIAALGAAMAMRRGVSP